MENDKLLTQSAEASANSTERKRAEEALCRCEHRLDRVEEMAHLGTWEVDLTTNRLSWSDEVYRIFGLQPQQFGATYEAFLDAVHPEDRLAVEAAYSGSLREGRDGYEIEHRVIRQLTGEVRVVHEKCEHIRDASGRIIRSIGMVQDITERKRSEAHQVLLADVLRRFNQGGDLPAILGDTLRLIRDATGFDAVGLRLRQGEDCPYYEQNGFSQEFLREENFLCPRAGNGTILRDPEGRPVLECTCGLVLSGRTNPAMSCFTQGGSFWTNVSTELLALPREADPRTNPRNRCIHDGYQSVGLFPVRAGQRIIGLLQLNDRRQGRFTPELIAFYENLAQNIGLALQRATVEAALQQTAARLRLAQSHGGVGVWNWDVITGEVNWESEFEQLYGLASGTMHTYADWANHLHPEDLPRIEKERDAALSAHRPFEVEFRIRHATGAERWLASRGSGIYDQTGRLLRVTGVNIDITERKRIEQALRQAQDQLRQYAEELEKTVARRTEKLREAISELEQFSYAITHDMRGPLRGMQAFTELIAEECAGCSRSLSQEYFKRIQLASRRMDQLITDSLNYSKAARQGLTLEPIDLQELLSDLVETYPNLHPDKADIQIQPKLPVVLGNEAALTQCFSNLLGNAVKFTKPGTKPHIRVWAEPIPHPSATPSTQDPAPLRTFVRVWVEDDGVGIPKVALNRVFDIFQRASKDHEGTGIGLAIVRKVAQRMGGAVGVESEEGKGSRFWVNLAKAPD